MRILVTGGAGYIGSHTMVELLAQGHEPLVVDNFTNSSPDVLARVARLSNHRFDHLASSVTPHSITDSADIHRICLEFRPEVVLHFAGLKAVGESVTQPLDYYANNLGGVIALLQAMAGSACKKIIFSSSATVYGTPQYLPLDEAHNLAPINPYGRTKLFSEAIIADWVAAGAGRAAVALRYFNPVGAHRSGDIGENPKGIPNNLFPFISQVIEGKRDRLLVFGNDYDTADGTGVRDYIHISDLARGHCAALDFIRDFEGVEAINLGTGQGYSVLEVLKAFAMASGTAIPHAFAPRRAGDVAQSYANPQKAKDMLGWEAQYGLEAMCADALSTLRVNHPEGEPP